MYLWYNGRVADQAVYSSHNGGASESAVNVWGRDYPYLIGKIDPYEASVVDRISNYNWTVTYTAQELTELLCGGDQTGWEPLFATVAADYEKLTEAIRQLAAEG